jgi:hypothetical protein
MAADSNMKSYKQLTVEFSAKGYSYTVCRAQGSIFLRNSAKNPSTLLLYD